MAELDSGAIPPWPPAVSLDLRPAPRPIRGAGPKPEGRFDSFALGDEKVAHINIQVVVRGEAVIETGSLTALHVSDTAMFIADDFLCAHRVFIDSQDHLILFGYQGGPVFSAAKTAVAGK